jgi:hypothetical protein
VSRTELAFALALGASVCSCSGITHVGEPDVDQVALDLEACIGKSASCVQSGPVRPVESLVTGDHALRIDPGGSLEGPLQRPSSTARMNTLVVGYRALGDEGAPRQIAFGLVGDKPGSPGVVSMHTNNAAFRVLELAELDLVPAEGARVRIEVREGSFEIVYVLGRWNN